MTEEKQPARNASHSDAGGDQKNNKELYECKECGLHYKDHYMAEKCEAWCKEHRTCNVEITKQAEENLVSNSIELDTNKKGKEDQGFDLAGQVEELKKKNEEYLNNWKRSAADFINYKKDEMERVLTLVSYAKEDMIEKILPIFDSIELAEKHSNILENVGMSEWQKGFLQIKKQIEEFLKKRGIEVIKTVGEKFNPETMEAVGESEESRIVNDESGIVAEELQKGYIMNGKVIRPARVKVTK